MVRHPINQICGVFTPDGGVFGGGGGSSIGG